MAKNLAYLVAMVTKIQFCDHFCLLISNNDLLAKKWILIFVLVVVLLKLALNIYSANQPLKTLRIVGPTNDLTKHRGPN